MWAEFFNPKMTCVHQPNDLQRVGLMDTGISLNNFASPVVGNGRGGHEGHEGEQNFSIDVMVFGVEVSVVDAMTNHMTMICHRHRQILR